MARKKKIVRTSNAQWQKVKSYLWQQQRERGVYKYNSKNFNTLVSEVYNTLGKKFPERNKRSVSAIAEKAEFDLFTAPQPAPEPIEYYNIDRVLSNYQSDSFYSPFTIVTNFGGAYPDVEIPLADYEYQDSIFQKIIAAADEMRRKKGMGQTPEKKLVIEVDHKQQTIKIYVADQAPPKGQKGAKPSFATIKKTPETIENNSRKLSSNNEQLKEIEGRIKNNEIILAQFAKAGGDFMKNATPIIDQMKDLQRQKNDLRNENKTIEKFLSDTGEFGKTKKAGKGRAKKKSKGAGPKRKRK